MSGKKFVLFLSIAILVLLTATTFAQTNKLKRIGVYTLVRIRGNVPTQEVMKTLVDRYAGDIKMGFDLAGQPDLYLPFMEQLKAANFKDTQVPVGGVFEWMLFRSQGRVKVARNLEWAGAQPLEVFGFDVRKDFKTYHYIIPKPCGNIALVGVTEEIPEAVCSLSVTPDKVNVGDPVTADVSGAKGVKSVTVEVYDAKGTKVATQTLTPAQPKWQTKFDAPGEYNFKAVALNMADKPSSNPCAAKVYVNFPPVCKLVSSCLPCNDYVGRTITFDASGSTDPDGEIIKAVFNLSDQSGQVSDSFTATQKPFVWERLFTKAGTYTISVAVYDNAGGVTADADACKLTFEVTQKKFFWLVEAGPALAHGTYTTYFFLRGGFLYWLAPDQFSLVVRAGGAVPSRGEPWKSFFLADVMGEYHAGPVWLGAGVGYSSKDQDVRESGLDLVGDAGVDVFNKRSGRGSIFFEFRSPVGSRSFDDHHKFLLGFRMLF